MRYLTKFTNPTYSHSAYVWDKEEKKVVISFSYPDLSIKAQQMAKEKCLEWIRIRETQLEFDFGDKNG